MTLATGCSTPQTHETEQEVSGHEHTGLIQIGSSDGIVLEETFRVAMKFMVVYSLMAAAYIVWWFWRKRRAGVLLLNIGRSKGCIVLGVVFLLLETAMAVWTVFLPGGLILLFMGLVGRQVRENGFLGIDWHNTRQN
jgi:hypothetical protein